MDGLGDSLLRTWTHHSTPRIADPSSGVTVPVDSCTPPPVVWNWRTLHAKRSSEQLGVAMLAASTQNVDGNWGEALIIRASDSSAVQSDALKALSHARAEGK